MGRNSTSRKGPETNTTKDEQTTTMTKNKTVEEKEGRPVHLQKLDTLIDPTKSKERAEKVQATMLAYKDRFGAFEFDKGYQSMFNLLWYSQLPCSDVSGITSSVRDELSFIKRCYWKKTPISCNAIFQKRPTDRGMCCSFNIRKAEDILKKSQYTNAISARQEYDSKAAFETRRKPSWFVKNNEPFIKAGIENGLSLVFDGHSDRVSSGSIVDTFRGVPILIDGKDKFPLVKMSGITARPGFENSISVNALDVKALNQIREHSPKKRKCYFPDEYKLDMHQSYSRPSCIFECEIKFATKCLSTCKEFNETCDCLDKELVNGVDLKTAKSCVPWFYPIQDSEIKEMCDPWTTKKFRDILEKKLPKGQCNHCLEDCSATKYHTSISYSELHECDNSNVGSIFCDLASEELNPAPWTSDVQNEYLAANESIPWFLETNTNQAGTKRKIFSDQRSENLGHGKDAVFAEKLKMSQYYNAFEKDIGIVNIFFADKEVIRYVKTKRGTAFDFISQIGGSLGGFMGISILSVIEIFYWIFFRFFGRMVQPIPYKISHLEN